MTTEWTDLPTLQDIAAAQARGMTELMNISDQSAKMFDNH